MNIAVLDQDNFVINVVLGSEDSVLQENEVAYTDENPALIGAEYIEGYFYVPQPFPSWTRSEGSWLPPIPKPTDHDFYDWDEAEQKWVSLR